jgi:hypothetical protein
MASCVPTPRASRRASHLRDQPPSEAAVAGCQRVDRISPKGGFVLKILSYLFVAAVLSGCLPIGIRGTSLPNYADAPRAQGADAQAIRHVV